MTLCMQKDIVQKDIVVSGKDIMQKDIVGDR